MAAGDMRRGRQAVRRRRRTWRGCRCSVRAKCPRPRTGSSCHAPPHRKHGAPRAVHNPVPCVSEPISRARRDDASSRPAGQRGGRLTAKTMQVARLYGIEDVRVETVPVPEPGPGELLVRVEACGLCSTDARKYRIGLRDGGYPFNPGHEWLGTVEAVGVGVDGWRPGERAYGDAYGGYAEYAVVRAARSDWSGGAMALDKNIPRNRAVFLEPLADCLHGVLDQGRVREGDQVVVFSAGSMGLQLAAMAARAGGRVMVVEPIQARRDLALTFGAEAAVAGDEWKDAVPDWTNGHGPDVAIVA